MHDTGAYGAERPRLEPAVRPLLRRFDRRRLSLVSSLQPPPARLLDVGAGRGRFVVSATATGYDAVGIEPSVRGSEAAAAIGASVERSTVEEASFDQGAFDVVSLWHVLEHLEQPAGALERIAEWLAPGGVLLIGVPNLASLQARLGGARWYHLDVPRHRVHFTPLGLERLLGRFGFEIVRRRDVLLEHNPFGMWQSLVSRVTIHPSYLYNVLKRNAPLLSPDLLITTLALPLSPVAGLLELAAGLARRGGTIAVAARRGE
jgi:SAM-dependent methyltransferase